MLTKPPREETRAGETFDRAGWLILAALTAVAVAMRFYRLGSVPVGLHYDEAFNGLDALALVDTPVTGWPIFFNGNYGREPLFIWLSGLAHALLGPSIFTARLISALSGSLLIPALAWLGWSLGPSLGVRDRRPFALWCSAAILALLWSQIFARYGIRASLFVLIETLLWAALWRAWQRPPPAIAAWLMTGVLAGLSFYTYLPARLLPLVILPLLAAAFFQDRPRLMRHLPGLLVGLLAAIAVAAPLGIYFLQNPVAFSTRIGQVTTGIGAREVFANLLDALGMFFLSGDQSSTANLPFRPALDPFLTLPFLIGLGLALRNGWKLGRLFLLVGLGAFLLPTILSDYAAKFQRAIGVLPFIGLLAAFGSERLTHLVESVSHGRLQRTAKLLPTAIIATSILLTNWTYFKVWTQRSDHFYGMAAGFTKLASLVDQNDEARVYLSPRRSFHMFHAGQPHPSSFYHLTAKGITPQYHDDRFCIRVALAAPARYFSLIGGENSNRLQIDAYFPDSEPRRPAIFDGDGNVWATEFFKGRDAPALFPEMRPHAVELADGIRLAGYRIAQENIQPNQPLGIRLFWRIASAPSADYTTFIHLAQGNEDGTIARLAGFDRKPGDGTCPTTEWLPGEMVIDEVEMILPADLPLGALFLAVGFYTPSDGRRLPISGTADNQILIGPLPRGPAPATPKADDYPGVGRAAADFSQLPTTSPRPSPARRRRVRPC